MMSQKGFALASAGVIAAIALAGTVWAREISTAGPEPGMADARVVVSIGVAREGDAARYSVWLENPGALDVRDVFVALRLPAGGTPLDAGPNAAADGFQSVQDGAAVWLRDRVPARGSAGPLTYRVRPNGDVMEEATAWVHWKAPTDGTNVSGSVRVLPRFNSGQLAASTVTLRGPGRWVVEEERTPAQSKTPPDAGGPAMRYVLEGIDTRTDGTGMTVSAGPGGVLFDGPEQYVHTNYWDSPGRVLRFRIVDAATPAVVDSPTVTRLMERDVAPDGLAAGRYRYSFDLVEVQPGGSVPEHYHPGTGAVYILEGTLRYNTLDGTTLYGTGSSFVEEPGMLHSASNAGGTPVKILAARVTLEGQASTVYTIAPPHPWTAR